MTQFELGRYYWALSSQAHYMGKAIECLDSGQEQSHWYSMMLWAMYKHTAKEIADAYDTMAFARAMGMSDGIRKAWE
jgi:hypothetical protein